MVRTETGLEMVAERVGGEEAQKRLKTYVES
jgi:hypothetical protein